MIALNVPFKAVIIRERARNTIQKIPYQKLNALLMLMKPAWPINNRMSAIEESNWDLGDLFQSLKGCVVHNNILVGIFSNKGSKTTIKAVYIPNLFSSLLMANYTGNDVETVLSIPSTDKEFFVRCSVLVVWLCFKLI